MKTVSQFRQWLDHRTGVARGISQFLAEAIPSSVGWRNTLGAVAGGLLLVQILTGILLALYYVPHPEAAQQSITFIQNHVSLGNLTRALHYWAASFMVVALFIHMIRVFVSGAYKKPRELTWLIGLAMFALVLGLGFTGQLLPWNQEGYWAAKVGSEIAGAPPIIGPVIKTLMLGGETLGALTLTRFYALHVVILPLMLCVLVIGHIYLLRKHSPARPARDTGDATIPFFPTQLFRDIVMVSVVLLGLLITTLIWGSPEDAPVDPTDTSYLPRPAWYFMSHFELLRHTPGSMKVVGTTVLPAILGALLAALPWLDRSDGVRFTSRKLVLTGGFLFFASVVGLTAVGIAREADHVPALAETEVSPEEDEVDADVKAGRTLFRRLKCMDCHRINGRGKTLGPDLSGVGYRLQEDYLRAWIKDPISFNPETTMPVVTMTDAQLDQIVSYLRTLQTRPEP